MSKEQKKAIVIGGGFGGLALAIRLQASGAQVTILEARDKAGGRAYVYEQDGFRFDAGPTVLTVPSVVDDLFTLAGKQRSDYIEFMPLTPYYRLLWQDGEGFDYVGDEKALEETVARISPDDLEGYRRFRDYSHEVFLEGYVKLAHVPFLNIWSMVRAAPNLVKLQSYRSVYAIVARFIKNEKLRQAFSYHTLLVGGNPFSTSAIYALIHSLELKWGVHFPKGGTGALVASLVRLFEDLGGEIRLSTPVDEIETTNNQVTGVRLKNGETLKADFVASNADIMHTYRYLLRTSPPANRKAKKLERSDHSMSLFLVYFGIKGSYPDLAHHTILFGPRYKELLTDIFDRGILADDFSLYLHSPSVTDSSMAPEGHSTHYVLAPVPHLGSGKVDWETAGPQLQERILTALEERCMPELKEKIVTQKTFTPLDFESELNAWHGSAFSLQPTLLQSAWFRVHNRDSRIKGMYFAGAGTHPGAGIPGVINSARATAGLMLEDMGLE
ncbi:MAG: phytoene desaturase [Gammaproteobacteria bacterium]|nr:phytoene desaturase [Gammaproteobacteria bacterium]